jgi:hypothetical protein
VTPYVQQTLPKVPADHLGSSGQVLYFTATPGPMLARKALLARDRFPKIDISAMHFPLGCSLTLRMLRQQLATKRL